MHKYIIEVETSMMLGKMLRIFARIEKLIHEKDHSVKHLSILEVTDKDLKEAARW